MRLVRLALLLGILAAMVPVLAPGWPVSAQGTPASTSRTLVGRLNDSNVNVWVAGIVDPDGWAAVGAASDNDAWNAQHSRWYRGRVVDGQFTGQATDGTALTARLDGSQLQGTVAGQPWSATVIGGGTAGVYIGGNSREIAMVIEAPDGSRIGRVWSRPTGQHLRTLIFTPASSGPSGSYSVLSLEPGSQGGASNASITVQPNGARQVTSGDATWTTSWCSSSFCG
jgi:hypothetical protein